jgi:hypothetical protein
MLLRDHPRMRYRGVPSWPPTWTWTGGLENQHPGGEIGILKAIELSHVQPACFLSIHHEGSSYLGCLPFDDDKFCRYVAQFLENYCHHSIAEIGSLDVTYTM